MTDAIVHPVPSETTIAEDASTLLRSVKGYFHRNGDALWALTLTGASILINRSIVRRELKRLQFNIEIFPNDEWGDYGAGRFDDD